MQSAYSKWSQPINLKLIGTSLYNDEGKSRKLNKLSTGKCVICNGVPDAQNTVVDKTCINDAVNCILTALCYCIFWKMYVFSLLNIYLLKNIK